MTSVGELFIQLRHIVVPLSLVQVTGHRSSQAVLLGELTDTPLLTAFGLPGGGGRTGVSVGR